MRGGRGTVTVTRQEHCATCRGRGPSCRRGSPLLTLSRLGRPQVGPRTHGVLAARARSAAARACRARRSVRPAADSRSSMRTESLGLDIPPGSGRWRADSDSRQRARGRRTARSRATCLSPSACEPHPIFRREGDDLHVTVPVAIHEAALGAKIDVPSLEGPARAPRAAGHAVRSAVPFARARRDRRATGAAAISSSKSAWCCRRLLDERSKELLREFGRINADDVRARTRPSQKARTR